MDKNAIFNHYSAILDRLVDTNLFFPYFLQMPNGLDEDVLGLLGGNINLHFGATRACFEDIDYPYVVKMNLRNRQDCEREEYVYIDAVNNDLQDYFAEVCYIGMYSRTINFYDSREIEENIGEFYDIADFESNFMSEEEEFGDIQTITLNVPLYAYARAVPHRFQSHYEEEEELFEVVESIRSPLVDEQRAIGMEFVMNYGEDEYARLSEFLLDEDINDIHAGNVADIDGRLVIIDYSGFYY